MADFVNLEGVKNGLTGKIIRRQMKKNLLMKKRVSANGFLATKVMFIAVGDDTHWGHNEIHWKDKLLGA